MTTSQPIAQSADQPISSVEVSPVKTSVLQASKLASKKGRDQECSSSSFESFAQYDPATSSWKTSQPLFPMGSTLFLGKWPKQGMTRNGRAYLQKMWEPSTSEIGGGSLPTPTAREHKDSGPNVNYQKLKDKSRLTGVLVILRRESGATGDPTYLNPSFVEEMMGYPVGWTDLRLSEIQSFPKLQPSPSPESSKSKQMPTAKSAQSDDRKIVSVSMKTSLFRELETYCDEIDIPVSLFVRLAVKKQLDKEQTNA